MRRKKTAVRDAWRVFRRSNRVDDYVEYKEKQAELKREMAIQQRASFDRFTDTINNQRSNYSAWRCLDGLKPCEPAPPAIDRMTTTDKTREDVQQEAEQFYQEIYRARQHEPEEEETDSDEAMTNEEEGLQQTEQPVRAAPQSIANPFSEKEFRWALKHMRNTAPGDDGVQIRWIKQLAKT